MCPNKKQILLVDDAYVSESEDEMPELEDDTNKDDDKSIDCWPHLNVASLMAHKVQRDDKVIVEPGQRRSIFQTACIIKGEVCKLIVDGGSASNMISKDVVESLSLPTWEHPKPYYMQWINGVGKLKVTHRVKVPFTVDGYVDKVECDVLPLHVCHLLLGRPWQHDVNALHHGRTNRYSFMHKGEFYTFLPKDAKDINCTVEVFKKSLQDVGRNRGRFPLKGGRMMQSCQLILIILVRLQSMWYLLDVKVFRTLTRNSHLFSLEKILSRLHQKMK
jgi:hypothetical protein